MHHPHPLRTSLRTQRPSCRQKLQRYGIAAVIGVAVATSGLAGTASAADAKPESVSGDPHSPRVARLATVALEAKTEYDRDASADAEQLYDRALSSVAAATAAELGVNRLSVEQAWERADSVHQTAVLTALTQLGVQYRSNTSEPFVGFDCSGLTTYAWAEAGIELPRQSGSQISAAEERTEQTAMAGDLVQYPGHVMMYLGVANAVVHASNPETDVELWLLGDRSVRFGDPTT